MAGKTKENRSKKLTVRLTPKEWEQVSQTAAGQGYTESDYVRKHLLSGPARAPRTPLLDVEAFDYQRALMIRNWVEQIRLANPTPQIEFLLQQIEAEAEQLQNRVLASGEERA